MAHEAQCKDDAFTPEEAGQILLRKLAGSPEVDPQEALQAIRDDLVAEREKELMRLAELERFRKLIVGRELKMIELKKEIEDLKSKIQKV